VENERTARVFQQWRMLEVSGWLLIVNLVLRYKMGNLGCLWMSNAIKSYKG